jgi:serine/threonine protein phosphatase 1
MAIVSGSQSTDITPKMFQRFRLSRPPVEERTEWLPNAGAGNRVYAIGDIHGRLDLFRQLLDMVIDDAEMRGPTENLRVILLGDLVDRGPDSANVVALAMQLCSASEKFCCLMGNHEEIFLSAIAGDRGALRFFRNTGVGGFETLISYGVEEELILSEDDDALHARILECVPASHLDFLNSLPHSIVMGDYAFVHAGIRPGIAIDEQDPTDLHWIRQEFLKSEERHSHMVIHGHSITEYVDQQPNRIGIDTGAYASNRLSAVGLEGTDRWFLST